MEKDYYKTLGIARDAVDTEIKKAFRTLAFLFHPDKNEGDKEAEEHFKEIQEAYETLIDSEKRKLHDLKLANHPFYNYFEQSKKEIQHYFYAIAEQHTVRLNEELKITFTYSGEGRLFRRPSFINFFLTGTPFVSFRKILISDVEVKETSFTYIVAPLSTGDLKIEEAYIRINQKIYSTKALDVEVKENNCHFAQNRVADGIPFKYLMNYESVSGSEKRKTIKNIGHTVLVPRSHYAQVYHRIGTSMKIFFFAWGFLLGWKIDVIPLFSGLGGLLFGGFFCNVLYLIARVKPKFYFAKKNAVVKSYLEKGYRSGSDSGSQFINSEVVYFITTLFF